MKKDEKCEEKQGSTDEKCGEEQGRVCKEQGCVCEEQGSTDEMCVGEEQVYAGKEQGCACEEQGCTCEEQGYAGEKNKQDSRQKIYPSMTDQDIKKLAEDMYKGLIFSNVHIERQEDVMMVFMPLILSGKEFIDKLQKNPPGMIYEYIDKAGPMAINGMPIFSSCKMVSIEDTKKVFDYYNKIVDVVASVKI